MKPWTEIDATPLSDIKEFINTYIKCTNNNEITLFIHDDPFKILEKDTGLKGVEAIEQHLNDWLEGRAELKIELNYS